MKKLVIMAMALGFYSLDLSAQNNNQNNPPGSRTQSSLQDTSRKRMQDTNRDRRRNDRNRTNRIDTAATSPVDTAMNKMNNRNRP